MGIPKGTKLTNSPKSTIVKVRMDNEILKMLDCLVSEQDSDRSKIIRQAIEIQYKQKDKK